MNRKFAAFAAQRGYDPKSAEYAAARDAWDAALTEVAAALPDRAGEIPGGRILLDAYGAVSKLHTWAG